MRSPATRCRAADRPLPTTTASRDQGLVHSSRAKAETTSAAMAGSPVTVTSPSAKARSMRMSAPVGVRPTVTSPGRGQGRSVSDGSRPAGSAQIIPSSWDRQGAGASVRGRARRR